MLPKRSRIPALTTALLLTLAGLTPATASGAATSTTPFSFAVIGDTPYGPAQLASLPQRIGQLNADPTVHLVGHVGDIGSPVNCSSSYFRIVAAMFAKFADPMLYTPGDNEWADCHRAAVGAGDPLARLNTLRSVFFPTAGRTMGVASALTDAQTGYRENATLDRQRVTFATVHLVGSLNGLEPWTGLGKTSVTPAQRAEVTARTGAAIAHLRHAFHHAHAVGSRAVVLMMQADMFVGTQSPARAAYQGVVRVLAEESATFGRPVFLFNGDTHVFRHDSPLSNPKWLSSYGLSTPVPNLSRITIKGGSTSDEWVKVTVGADASVLRIQRVRFR